MPLNPEPTQRPQHLERKDIAHLVGDLDDGTIAAVLATGATYAEIEQGAGDQGVYSPWSWWPLAIGLAAAILFAGLAIGWWLVYVGAVLGALALVGWVFEFSRGQHAH